jgi:hypothetical protein
MKVENYISIKRLAHAVRSWEEFAHELGRLKAEERPYLKEGYKWFYERYKSVKHIEESVK